MKREKLIESINAKFIGAKAVTSEEFGISSGGIWVKGTEDLQLLNDYGEIDLEFDEWCTSKGWFCELYDAGTLMIFKI